jgi:hypothetical protein
MSSGDTPAFALGWPHARLASLASFSSLISTLGVVVAKKH